VKLAALGAGHAGSTKGCSKPSPPAACGSARFCGDQNSAWSPSATKRLLGQFTSPKAIKECIFGSRYQAAGLCAIGSPLDGRVRWLLSPAPRRGVGKSVALFPRESRKRYIVALAPVRDGVRLGCCECRPDEMARSFRLGCRWRCRFLSPDRATSYSLAALAPGSGQERYCHSPRMGATSYSRAALAPDQCPSAQ
jgi:hypothetical protein